MFGLLKKVVVASVVLTGAAAHGGVINVPNGSFETPSASTAFGVSTAIDNWTTYGDNPFDTGGGLRSSGTGIFPNVNPDTSVNFTNAHLSQVAYIFSKSSIATNRDGMEQILSSSYVAGQQYTLTLAVGLAGSNPGATEPLNFTLFYFDPSNPTARTPVATRTIYNDGGASTDGLVLSKTSLTDLSVTTPILPGGDIAVGKQIGIEITTALGSDTSVTAGKQYILDNVRVTEVPEPATVGLLAASSGLLALRRHRRPSR